MSNNQPPSATTDTKLTFSSNDSAKELFVVYLKGIAMGAADIVPGVSGGTIALIAGIYHRLINALGSIDLNIWHLWRRYGLIKGFVKVWQYVDATFLVCLLAGIATSFVSLAGIIHYLLDNQPLKIWSFFFGLVIATVFVLLKQIHHWNGKKIALFILGLVFAVCITMMPINEITPSLPYIFFAGASAICAMILPGISGSFILLLLGVYATVLHAIHTINISIIATLILGMMFGLLLFTRILKWLLANFYQETLALLTGFIAGSLLKLWPWQLNNTYYAFWDYPLAYNSLLLFVLILLGATSVFFLSWLGKKTS